MTPGQQVCEVGSFLDLHMTALTPRLSSTSGPAELQSSVCNSSQGPSIKGDARFVSDSGRLKMLSDIHEKSFVQCFHC